MLAKRPLHYPPKVDDAVGLFDRLFGRAIEAAKPVQALAQGLKHCADALEELTRAVAVLVHNQAVHHQMIQQVWIVQQRLISRANEASLDTALPDPMKKDDTTEKPN